MEAIKQPNQNNAVANSNTYEITPKVYVGTYHKYNCGSIEGEWVKLKGHTKESFFALCRSIHSDEVDPELMFQDYEGFPSEYYGECSLSEKLWDWLELDEDDRELLTRYTDALGYETSLEEAQDALCGKFSSEADFAEDLARQTDVSLDDLPSWVVIDWQATWQANLRHDYCTSLDGEGTLWFFRQ